MMRNRIAAGLLAVTACSAAAAQAQDKRPMGNLTAQLDGVVAELEIFHGPIMGYIRSMASYRTGFGGDGGLISIEALPPQAQAGAHPLQGMVGLRMEFSAPAPLDADSPADGVTMNYVRDWSADNQEPESVFQSTDDVTLELHRLDFTEGAASVVGMVAGTLCPYDINSEETDAGSAECFEASFQFDTALAPFAPAVPVETPPDAGAAAADDGPVTMNVLGRVTGTLDGEPREWLTLEGEIEGGQGASANWQRTEISIPGFADSFGDIADQLSPEDRAQLEALDEMFGGENNPMAEMMGQITGQPVGGQEHINLTISGHDPASPNILTEQVLAIDVYLTSTDVPAGASIPAEINYFVEASGSFIPKLFYVSGEDGSEASVTFERLDLEPGGGHATGSFSATLCRMEGARLMDGADLSDCMTAEGRFDTELVEEEPIRF